MSDRAVIDVWDPDDDEQRYQVKHASYRGAAFSFLSTPRGEPHWSKRLWETHYDDRLTPAALAQVYKVPVDMIEDSAFDMEAEVKRETERARDAVDAFSWAMRPAALATEASIREGLEKMFAGRRLTPALQHEVKTYLSDNVPIAYDPSDIKVECDRASGRLDVTFTMPIITRHIEDKVKLPEPERPSIWVPPDADVAPGETFLGFDVRRSERMPLLEEPGPDGGFLVPEHLEGALTKMLDSPKTSWVGEPRKFVTSVPTEPLTIDKLRAVRDELARGYDPSYQLRFPQPERTHPMKSAKIAIPFNQEEPLEVALVDMPRHCEVVHVSGNKSEAFLHINTVDDPSNAKTPNAFFVVRDGVDIPGLVVTSSWSRDRHDGNDPRYSDSSSDAPEPIYARRVGKFSYEHEVYFIFERQ